MEVLPFTVDIIPHESDLGDLEPEYGKIIIAADTQNEFVYQPNKWEIIGNVNDNETKNETKIVYNRTHCKCCGAPYSSERTECEYCGTLYE